MPSRSVLCLVNTGPTAEYDSGPPFGLTQSDLHPVDQRKHSPTRAFHCLSIAEKGIGLDTAAEARQAVPGLGTRDHEDEKLICSTAALAHARNASIAVTSCVGLGSGALIALHSTPQWSSQKEPQAKVRARGCLKFIAQN